MWTDIKIMICQIQTFGWNTFDIFHNNGFFFSPDFIIIIITEKRKEKQ